MTAITRCCGLVRGLRRHLLAGALLAGVAGPAAALNSATIIAASLSPDCLEYRVVGICYWLSCGAFGCTVLTSVKIRHYVPDAVVSAYSNTGGNPWVEVRPLGLPNPTAQAGGDAITSHDGENAMAKFKNADVIGHPAGASFTRFLNTFGQGCTGAATAFVPYLVSTLDTLAWRYNVPEVAYPEALVPGQREVGARTTVNLWGNVYPRGGFLHGADDYKGAAVTAQRAGDIVTRQGQPHVYQPMLSKAAQDGYWPAGALIEGDAATGKWQELTPTLSTGCAVFPHTGPQIQAQQGDYAFALWRPYACCRKRGQVFLGSSDFL